MRKRVLIAFLTLLAFGVSPSLVLAGGPTAHPPVCVAKPDVQPAVLRKDLELVRMTQHREIRASSVSCRWDTIRIIRPTTNG